METTPHTCPEHLFMSENLKELKAVTASLVLGQQTLTITITKLTENLGELQRMNLSLEKFIAEQSQRISATEEDLIKQRDFMNKAIGVIGTLTLLVPIISEMIKHYIKNGVQ